MTNEQELVLACVNGNSKAQKHLFDSLSGKMLAICARYCRNMEDARDAMQEGFIKVYNSIGKFNGKSKLETWITRIMINTSIDLFKKNNKFSFIENIDRLTDYDITNEPFEIDEHNHEKKCKLMYDALQNLPDGYRTVFNLYVMEGYNHREIGELLGISQGTSKSQLARARKHLQKELKNKILV